VKILICGVGSIGERHIRNLLTLGYEDIILYRTSNSQLRSLDQNFKTFNNLEEALLQKPDIAFITNPTSLHLNTAISCALAGCHLFVEKPLSNSLEGVDKLNKIVIKKDLVCMTGFMYRYHPLIQKMKEITNSKILGELIWIRSSWGEYLPDWHPWEDYRTGYAAKDKLGGGPTATLSHDIDLAIWFSNSEVKKFVNFENHQSKLELETSHGNDILIKFYNGVTANIHVDFFQKPYHKEFEIVFTEGKLNFNYYNNKLYIISTDEKDKKIVMKDFNRNEMFLLEIKDFINAIINKKASPISINESLKSMQIIDSKNN
jgi:predicted dehydrogenase